MQTTTRSLAPPIALMSMLFLAGCGGESQQPQQLQLPPSWEEFRAQAYQEPDTGIFIINGDEPILNETRLREFYDAMIARQASTNGQTGVGVAQQPLTAISLPGWPSNWSIPVANNLTYCISSTSFGADYTKVVSAMRAAALDWKGTGANLTFVHASSLDSTCDNTTNVMFNLRMVSNQAYLARAFFPGDPRYAREVLIDASSFSDISPWTLTGVLRHELGHVLGFRHEHIRVPQVGDCLESDNYWRALTPYDSASVMHYPQCNGTNTGDLTLTSRDVIGVRALYPAALLANERLLAGQSRYSSDGQFYLSMQTDGNLVLYWTGHGPLWSTVTGGSQGRSAWMQDDGNFVLYTTDTPVVGRHLWASNTGGRPGAYLAIQTDGNLVVYASDGVTPLWASNTGGH